MRKALIALLVFCFFVSGVSVYSFVRNQSCQTLESKVNDLILPVVRIKGESQQGQWTGSGVIIYSQPNLTGAYDSILLTCNHCVEIGANQFGVKYVEIFNKDGTSRKVPGRVLAQTNNNTFTEDQDNPVDVNKPAGEDLALVLLDTQERLPTANLMSRAQLPMIELFDKVRVVGCSLGGKPYHTSGEITILDKLYMSASAQFVPGNSGGAIYLDEGHYFIGITNAGITPVWHMGLIRPLVRIYDWFDSIGYKFLYDKSAPKDALIIEKDKAKFEVQQQIKYLLGILDKINEENTQFSQQNKLLEEMVSVLTRKVEELQKQLEELAKIMKEVETVETTDCQDGTTGTGD